MFSIVYVYPADLDDSALFLPACAVQIEQSSLESVQKQTKIKFFPQTLASTRDFVAKHTSIEQQRRLDVETGPEHSFT